MFIDTGALVLFALASTALIVVPGPTVTVIVANSLSSGARAGLFVVLGTQLGLASMLLVLALGFGAIVDRLGAVFEVLRFVGALYLVWLGVRLWKADGASFEASQTSEAEATVPASRYVWQGFLVIWSNPKVLVLFGAFIPQFVDPGAAVVPQVMTLGLVFMLIATVFDCAYAMAAGQVGQWLSRQRARVAERCAAVFMIGGGIWLALGGGLEDKQLAVRGG